MNPFLYDFDLTHQAYLLEPYPSNALRKDRIRRLVTMLNENEENLCKVIQADFGFRNEVETQIAEILMIRRAAKEALQHLSAWTAKQRVKTPKHLRPSQSYIQPQPKGVVGIMSPWNYPLSLALIPIIAAFAAGNRVWLKPSERSARTSGYLATLVQQYFSPSELTIINGGEQVARQFSELPFHHLMFTGSTKTGQLVAIACAENLTPVTLELGGKSPAIIDSSANLRDACARILYGKLFNAGQTCIAPDYLLVPHQLLNQVITELQASFQKMYPDAKDLTHPIDQAQLERWQAMVQDSADQGCRVIPLLDNQPAEIPFVPTLIVQPPSHSWVMSEEVFGPILPILGYADMNEVISFINQQPSPLSLYWFGKQTAKANDVLLQTKVGGVTLNDTLLHGSSEFLPFGGIGASGMGVYHGKFGFETFSHLKPILEMRGLFGLRSLGGTKIAHPPYGKKIKRLLKILA